jgi:diguanylate cyclase (GGDEF)-like protein
VLVVGDADYAQRLQHAFEEARLAVKTAVVSNFYMALGHVSRHRPGVVIGAVSLLTAGLENGGASGVSGGGQADHQKRATAVWEDSRELIQAMITGFRRLAPQAKLIVTAATEQKALAVLAMEQGFDGNLVEPWSADQLAAMVDKPGQEAAATYKPDKPIEAPSTRNDQGTPPSQRDTRADSPEADVSNSPRGETSAAFVVGEVAAGAAFKADPWLTEDPSLSGYGSLTGDGSAGEVSPTQDEAFTPAGSSRASAAIRQDDNASARGGAVVSGQTAGAYHNDPFDASDAELGDIDLVDQLLSAPGAFDELVLKLVAARSGVARVGFASQANKVPEGHVGAWVSHRGRRLGVLHAPPPAVKAQLAPWASWMGHWLALERQMKLLWHKAHQDELSGAWNRRFFDHHLARVINQAAQRRLPVTLLVFDIDNFKTYNDRYGHAAGDEILRETVRLMRSVIREHDMVARIGGDEFAVIFWDPQGPRKPNSSHPEDVRAAAQRFQKAICAHHFPKLLEEAPGTLTISGGLASYPWDGVTADTLVERADAMLLHSKSQGKNAITFGSGAAHAGQEHDPFAH